MKICTEFEFDTTIHCLVLYRTRQWMVVLLLVCYVTLWAWPLTFWPWSVVIYGRSRDQPFHPVWRTYGYLFLSYGSDMCPIGYDWQCICSHCAWPYHVTYRRGQISPTYLKSLTPICLLRMGPGHSLSPCPITSSSFALFYFSVFAFLIRFIYFLVWSIPSLSTTPFPGQRS